MVKVKAFLMLTLVASVAVAKLDRPEFESAYRAQAGTVALLGSGDCITGGIFRMTGPDTFGPTNHFAEVQMWTERPSETMTVAFGARAISNYLGIVMMACPNADATATNPAVNRFEILDVSSAGVYSGYPTTVWNWDSALMLATNGWHHYAYSYTPRGGVWKWYRDGLRQGTTNVGYAPPAGGWAGVWTNGWQTDAVMILQTMSLPMGSSPGRPEFDHLFINEGALTDAQVYREYLKWTVRRRGITLDEPFALTTAVQAIPRTVPDSILILTNSDAILYSNAWNETRFDQRVDVSVSRGSAVWGLAVDGGYTINACGVISNTANGVANVTITATNTGVKPFTNTTVVAVAMTNRAESSVAYRTGVAGSLRATASDWVNSRVKTGQRSQWTTWDHASTNYQRSTNCWTAAAIGLEAASVWNSQSGSGAISPTLIAPDIVLGCSHAPLYPGARIRWVGRTNQVVESVVQAMTILNTGGISYPDFSIARIAPPVTAIHSSAIFPTNAPSFMPIHTNGWIGSHGVGIPCVKFSQTGRVDTVDISEIGPVAGNIVFGMSADTNRAAYYAPVQSGDSGNPVFVVINGTAVVATVWSTFTYRGAWTGGISNETWDAAVSRIGATGTIQRVNLSGFQEYP